MARLSNRALVDTLVETLKGCEVPPERRRPLWDLIKDIDARLNPQPPKKSD